MGVHKHPQFALRIPSEKIAKLKYIAEYNARSANREIDFLVTRHIADFEREHGAIPLEDLDHGRSPRGGVD